MPAPAVAAPSRPASSAYAGVLPPTVPTRPPLTRSWAEPATADCQSTRIVTVPAGSVDQAEYVVPPGRSAPTPTRRAPAFTPYCTTNPRCPVAGPPSANGKAVAGPAVLPDLN